MKRLSLFVAAAAVALAMFAMPAMAALSDDGPFAIERLDCTAPDFASSDFAIAIASPAAEQFTCDATLLAESGLCIVQVEPARVGLAFAPPPDPAWSSPAPGTCPGARSTTG